jgi:hypothetical protein
MGGALARCEERVEAYEWAFVDVQQEAYWSEARVGLIFDLMVGLVVDLAQVTQQQGQLAKLLLVIYRRAQVVDLSYLPVWALRQVLLQLWDASEAVVDFVHLYQTDWEAQPVIWVLWTSQVSLRL